jgi:hypothetical protein
MIEFLSTVIQNMKGTGALDSPLHPEQSGEAQPEDAGGRQRNAAVNETATGDRNRPMRPAARPPEQRIRPK